MMCFRDMAFCDSDCSNVACRRNFSPAQKDAAHKWWGKEGAPVAFDNSFRDGCDDYCPPILG